MRTSLIRDLAATARLPNLPTLWSTVTCAHWIALDLSRNALSGTSVPLAFSPATLAWLLLSATLLYLFGTFLNDAFDADFDRLHRPERAIPAGRLRRESVLHAGLISGCLGIAAALPAGKFAAPAAAAIACCVLLYSWLHKRTALAIIPMGLCRALLVPLAAAGVIHWIGPELTRPLVLLAAYMVLLMCYTCGISLAARHESTGAPGRWAAAASAGLLSLPFLLPALVVLGYFLQDPDAHGWQAGGFAGLCGSLGLAWVWFATSARASSPVAFVSRALPGLALVDAVALLPSLGPHPTLLAVPLLAFLLALLLQRFAPAT